MLFRPAFEGMARASDIELMLAAAFGLTMAGANHRFIGSLSVWSDNSLPNPALDKLHHQFSVYYRKLSNPGSKRGNIHPKSFKFPKHTKKG